jgi:hypothetical protein
MCLFVPVFCSIFCVCSSKQHRAFLLDLPLLGAAVDPFIHKLFSDPQVLKVGTVEFGLRTMTVPLVLNLFASVRISHLICLFAPGVFFG